MEQIKIIPFLYLIKKKMWPPSFLNNLKIFNLDYTHTYTYINMVEFLEIDITSLGINLANLLKVFAFAH